MSVFGKIVYGLQVAAIGLVVVFLGLAILIAFITLMAQVFKAVEGRKADKAAEAKRAEEAARAAEAAKAVAAPAAVEPEPVVEDVTDDSALIAVIAAAIAAFTDSDKQLVVRRVRRVSGWNRASRAEQVYRF